MNRHAALVVPLLLMLLAFAGCVGADSSSPATNGPGAPGGAHGPAEFDETTGAIEGVVTTVELAPIAGAVVGLLPSALLAEPYNAVTDETGRFTLNRVPPGDHALAASALGFTSASKRVSVETAVVAQVSIILEQLAIEEAYSVTILKRGAQTGAMLRLTPECLYLSQSVPEQVPSRNLLKTCNGARLCDSGSCEFTFVDELLKETNYRTIVAEMNWQPQSGATGRAYWLDLSGPNVSRQTGGSIDQADKRYWMKHQGKGPIQLRVDLPETLVERGIDEADWYSYPGGKGCAQSSCAWLYRAWPSYCDLGSSTGACGSTPVDYGIQQGAVYDVYFSIFYLEPAPPEFTGVPDA
jgi:hypothetical protein